MDYIARLKFCPLLINYQTRTLPSPSTYSPILNYLNNYLSKILTYSVQINMASGKKTAQQLYIKSLNWNQTYHVKWAISHIFLRPTMPLTMTYCFLNLIFEIRGIVLSLSKTYLYNRKQYLSYIGVQSNN
jgi:hypothetical protein